MAKFIFLSYQWEKFTQSFKQRGRFISSGLILSLLLNLANWLFLYLRLFPLVKNASAIPLHYTVYFGIDLLGPPIRIFLLPLLGFLVILINFILAYRLAPSDKFLSNYLAGATLLIEILLILGSAFLILINL